MRFAFNPKFNIAPKAKDLEHPPVSQETSQPAKELMEWFCRLTAEQVS